MKPMLMSVAIARQLSPGGVISEIVNDDGTMKRGQELRDFADIAEDFDRIGAAHANGCACKTYKCGVGQSIPHIFSKAINKIVLTSVCFVCYYNNIFSFA